MQGLEEAGIAAGPVLHPHQLLADPQVRHTGQLVALDYPGMSDPAPVADFPITLSGTPAGVQGPAPTLGADTDAVLRELGFDEARIDGWRTRGVI
jgi:crotonobetainyl-CoA:carnitine CoA-transferase CaiB-like acyl-CoA transferase